MPCAIVLGCPPMSPHGAAEAAGRVDEFTVAGGLAGAPINVVRAKTVDLLVPAESEIVIEGLIDTEYCEPKRLSANRTDTSRSRNNMPMRVTAITQRRNPIIPPTSASRAFGIERDQARRLRAAVPRAPSRALGIRE